MSDRKLLGELEQQVMNIMWKAEIELTPRDVLNRLDEKRAYTTVMTVMSALYDKGLLNRRKSGKGYVYTVLRSKAQYAQSRLHKHFSNLLTDFGSLAVTNFVDTLKNDPEALQLLDEYLKKVQNDTDR